MVISGISAWAHISTASKSKKLESGKVIKPIYSIDVILEPKLAKELKAKGLNIKEVKKDIAGIPDSAGKPFIQIKKPYAYQDGTLAVAPGCVDAQKKPYKGLIGNGSLVSVNFSERPYEMMGKKGISARLLGVQVVELAESDGTEVFGEVDGFTSVGVAVASAELEEADVEEAKEEKKDDDEVWA